MRYVHPYADYKGIVYTFDIDLEGEFEMVEEWSEETV